jgi:hypothetical protein
MTPWPSPGFARIARSLLCAAGRAAQIDPQIASAPGARVTVLAPARGS